MRKATACAVLAAFAAAGCSAGQSSTAARLSPSAVGSPAGSGHSPGTRASGSAAQRASASGSGTAQASAPSSDGSPVAFASPTPGTPSPVASNITVAPAGSMQRGPMKITAVYCGKLSAAQRAQFGTTAAGGLIYKYANDGSAGVSGSAKLYVGFTAGSGILGSNYAGTLPDVAPGKSAEGEVDAVDIEGRDLSFTGCEIMSYALITSQGVYPVSYAG